MGNIDSRNERFYNLCGLGKAHLIEKMLENDRALNTINVNWVAFETQSTPLLIVPKQNNIESLSIFYYLFLGISKWT